MDWLNRNVGALLALAIVLFCFAIFYSFSLGKIDPANKEIMLMILGAIISTLSTVVGYFFGSSQGSARKTEILAGPPAILGEPIKLSPPIPVAPGPFPGIDAGPPGATGD